MRPRLVASFLSFASALVVAALLGGCAAGLEPVRVRAVDLAKGQPIAPGQPLIVEFQVGDVLPVDLAIDSDLVDLAPSKPDLSFKVRRRFFARIDASGLAVSFDGVDFQPKRVAPGKLAFGLAASPEGARANVHLTAPKLAP